MRRTRFQLPKIRFHFLLNFFFQTFVINKDDLNERYRLLPAILITMRETHMDFEIMSGVVSPGF